jgi:hypothetical protein
VKIGENRRVFASISPRFNEYLSSQIRERELNPCIKLHLFRIHYFVVWSMDPTYIGDNPALSAFGGGGL